AFRARSREGGDPSVPWAFSFRGGTRSGGLARGVGRRDVSPVRRRDRRGRVSGTDGRKQAGALRRRLLIDQISIFRFSLSVPSRCSMPVMTRNEVNSCWLVEKV